MLFDFEHFTAQVGFNQSEYNVPEGHGTLTITLVGNETALQNWTLMFTNITAGELGLQNLISILCDFFTL